MVPKEFITEWRMSRLKERSESQEHFIDLGGLLGNPTLAEADLTGENRQFPTERAAASLATVVQALRAPGKKPHAVAHFVNRLVVCMFAGVGGLVRRRRLAYSSKTVGECGA